MILNTVMMSESWQLTPVFTPGTGSVQEEGGVWRLQISSGPAGRYRLAQLEDYTGKPRSGFPWRPPCSLEICARASSADPLPGTWGFGFWNDPFSLSLGLKGGTRRFPALPNAAWYFFASPPNYLSFRDDLPAQGGLAATFLSRNLPSPLLALGGVSLPLLVFPPLGRAFRHLARRIIEQDAVQLQVNPAEYHLYRIDWLTDAVKFHLDGETILHTRVVPNGPLGLVLWIDNQYAALAPDGRFRAGTLANPNSAWIEIARISLESGR